jgi:hypothetical protein
MIVAVVLAIALPALVSASTYTSSFTAGPKTGTITSVLPDLNNKPATIEVKQVGDKVIGTAEFAGGKEVWTWDDKTLEQQELDKTGKVISTYAATAAAAPAGNKQTYNINCKDKANNVCDANADSRTYWTLESTPTGMVYTVYGVGDKKNDKTAVALKRHEFKFNNK